MIGTPSFSAESVQEEGQSFDEGKCHRKATLLSELLGPLLHPFRLMLPQVRCSGCSAGRGLSGERKSSRRHKPSLQQSRRLTDSLLSQSPSTALRKQPALEAQVSQFRTLLSRLVTLQTALFRFMQVLASGLGHCGWRLRSTGLGTLQPLQLDLSRSSRNCEPPCNSRQGSMGWRAVSVNGGSPSVFGLPPGPTPVFVRAARRGDVVLKSQ